MASTAKTPSPDRICAKYATKKTSVVIRQLDDDTIMIEAPAAGLRFLAELLLAQAGFAKDCGFQLDRAAKQLDDSSEKGLYIHRLPCLHDKKTATKRPRRKSQLRQIK
jgi:hypothetical protein